jgi:hypothetical protein
MTDEYIFDLNIDFSKDGNEHNEFMQRLREVGYNGGPLDAR